MSEQTFDPSQPLPGENRSPRRAMCSAVLSLQGLTLALTTPVMIAIADVSTGTAVGVGIGLAVGCLLVAGLLRADWAYWLGWGLQLAAIGLGFVVTVMFFLGAIFALLWGGAFFLGRKIERERRQAFRVYRTELTDEPD